MGWSSHLVAGGATVITAAAGGAATDVDSAWYHRLPKGRRRPYATALGVNLVLNVGWSWIFFRGHSPAAATVEILALQASNVDLARRTTRIDRTAGLLLAPYLAWVGFAAVLTGDILRRNR